jgi:hypothetical protein
MLAYILHLKYRGNYTYHNLLFLIN